LSVLGSGLNLTFSIGIGKFSINNFSDVITSSFDFAD
jgi:hypothetical protein